LSATESRQAIQDLRGLLDGVAQKGEEPSPRPGPISGSR